MSSYAPSLLDKLLGSGALAPRLSAEQMRGAVARDIELLLNTRAAFSAAVVDGKPRPNLLTLGLPDMESLSLASDRDRARIAEAIRAALECHDKRLSRVSVQVRGHRGQLSFVINATLQLEQEAELVGFSAVLHNGSQFYTVSEAAVRGGAAA